MHPVLFTIGQFAVSTFGFFLLLSFLLSTYVIWRIIRVYEVDEERVFDLILLTFIGALVGARVLFVVLNYPQFMDPLKVLLINRYPGLSFWGGLLGGYLALRFFCSKLKSDFWQMADFAFVGLFLGLALSEFGCLFAGCDYGRVSNLPIVITQVGVVSKRFPIQLFESIVYLILFITLWRKVIRFHFNGKIAVIGLILLGLIKLIFAPFKGAYESNIYLNLSLPVILILYGIFVYYRQSKKLFRGDMRFLVRVFIFKDERNQLISKLGKGWYNMRTDWHIATGKVYRKVLKILNVKSNPKKF